MSTDTLSTLAAARFESLSTPAAPLLEAELRPTASDRLHCVAAMDRDDDAIELRGGQQRDEIVKRLRRAEGQLRGIVRMIEEGQGCLPIAQQLTAVRKALDATMARMTVSYLEQELSDESRRDPNVGRAVERVGLLISRLI